MLKTPNHLDQETVVGPRNRLLRALPDDVMARLLPALLTIPTVVKQSFHHAGEQIEFVYFPNGGVASLTVLLSDGTMVETTTVGNEGMVGIEAFFGPHPMSPGEAMMQVPDTDAERLSVHAFRAELARQGPFATVMGRYAQAVFAAMAQSVACNARHQLPERCCRWLLMTHDRVGRDSFSLSQEFLAVMLGVARPSISLVAGTLQAAGLIAYKHGQMTVVNREGLEEGACECYAHIRRLFDALLVS